MAVPTALPQASPGSAPAPTGRPDARPFPGQVPDGLGRKLDDLAAFPDNWDGYGARRFAPAMLAAVREFLARLGDLLPKSAAQPGSLLPDVVPLSSGAIQLDWRAADRGLELEFETPDLIHYLKWCPARGVQEEDVFPASDLGLSAALIRWVLTGNDA